MLVKRLHHKDNRFDVFLGKGWDDCVRVQVTKTKEKNHVELVTEVDPNRQRTLMKGLEIYFNRGK